MCIFLMLVLQEYIVKCLTYRHYIMYVPLLTSRYVETVPTQYCKTIVLIPSYRNLEYLMHDRFSPVKKLVQNGTYSCFSSYVFHNNSHWDHLNIHLIYLHYLDFV